MTDWVGKSIEEIEAENKCPTCGSIKAPLCLFCGGCPICDPDYCRSHYGQGLVQESLRLAGYGGEKG